MIYIHYDFTDGTEVSYKEGLKLRDNFHTNCLDFFNWGESVDDVWVIRYDGSILSRNALLKYGTYTSKEITKKHNIQKMLKANTFNW